MRHTTWKVICKIWGAQKVLFFEINRLCNTSDIF